MEAGKGHFLLIEAKSPKAPIPIGQARAFNALMKTGFFTILIIWGEPNKPEKYCLWEAEAEKQSMKTCDEGEIKYLVSTWFEYAESHPRP